VGKAESLQASGGEKDRGGGQTGEGRRGDRGDRGRGNREGGGTEREGEQRGRGDRQGGGTYIGVGTHCRSSVVALFAIRWQGVISVGIVLR